MSTKRQQEIVKAAVKRAVDHAKSDEPTAEPNGDNSTDLVDLEIMARESYGCGAVRGESLLAMGLDRLKSLLDAGYTIQHLVSNPVDGGVALELANPGFDGVFSDDTVYYRDILTPEQFDEALPILRDEILRRLQLSSPDDVEDESYDGPLIYSWLIPGDRGYALEIRVPGNVDVDTARAMALECPVGEGEDARGLSELERVYVSSIEPAVVRDTVDVSLDHQRALEANEKLRHENEAFATTKRVFADAGIDPHAPAEFVERVHDQANGRILAAQSEVADRGERLATALQGAIKHLREVAVMTGFVPYEPPVPAEPDYSDLTIVVDDASVKGLFPRLQDAVWVERMPGAEMPAAARSGYLLTATRLREFFRMKFGAGETEMADFDAFLEYLDIEIGKPS